MREIFRVLMRFFFFILIEDTGVPFVRMHCAFVNYFYAVYLTMKTSVC